MILFYLVQRQTNKVTLKLLILLNNNNKNTSKRQTIKYLVQNICL